MNVNSFIFFVSNIVFATTNEQIQKDINTSDYSIDMRNFLKELVLQSSKVIPKSGFLVWILNDIEPDIINFLIKEYFMKISGQIVYMKKKLTDEQFTYWSDNSHFGIIIVNPNIDTSEELGIITKFRRFRTTFVLLFLEAPPDFYVKISLDTFKTTKSYNFLLIYEKRNTAEVFTLDPGKKQYIKKLTDIKYEVNLFEDKLTNMHGSEIRALLTQDDCSKIRVEKIDNRTVYYVGKDYEIIKTMLDKIDAKLKILDVNDITNVNPFSNDYIWNKNSSNMKKSLFKKHDISFLITSEMFLVDDTFENLYPHTTNDFMVVLPSEHVRSVTKTILKMYSPDLWILNVTSPYILITIAVILQKFVRKPLKPWNICINIFSIAISNQFTYMPSASLGKVLLLGWMFYFYILNMYAQSKGTSVLTSLLYEDEIDKIDQLLHTEDLKEVFVMYKDFSEIVKALSDKKYEKFVNILEPIETVETDKRIAVILQHDQAIYLSRGRKFYREGKPMYHVVKESIVPSYQTFKIVFGSPLLPMMNKLMRRLLEGGIIDHLSKKSLNEATIQGVLYPANYDATQHFRALKLGDIEFAFSVLEIGLFCGFVTFLFELITQRIWRRCNKPYDFIL